MDFNFNEAQEAVRDLAGRIFTERSTHERLKAVEADAGEHGPFDADLWSALAESGLVGIGIGEDVGGGGLDFVAVAAVLEAAGRTAARVPVVEAMAYAAPALERFGTQEQRERWLGPLVRGELILTAATAEWASDEDLVVPGVPVPATTARPLPGGGWRIEGTKACVPFGLRADALLVPASLHGAGAGAESASVGVFIVPRSADGLTVRRQDGTWAPEALVVLDGVEVGDEALVGGAEADGAAVVSTIVDHAMAGLCVLEAGACAAALDLVGEYTKTREQFGKPIATFQAVGQRAADAYVDVEAVRLTAWQAAWRLATGQPADAELAVAKYWAAEGGQRAVHAAVHLHGGVGVDRDYPLHRYFLLTRQVELTLGGAHDSLRRLGAILAAAS
ncbi:MAG: acyl-CoA dehydrogenase family protein [Actinomycetota bacterium]|nr:acyl-CoA dehydrogenase family protein [Actinomycetota bacterium]